MLCYPENTQLAFPVEVVDAAGVPYTDNCYMEYKLYDKDGVLLFSGSDDTVEHKTIVIIASEHNRLAEGESRSVRRLSVRCTKPEDGSLIYSEQTYYFIQSETPLTVGENSFVSYEGYLLISSATPHLDNMTDKSKEEIIIALQEAHDRLMALRFRLPYRVKMENVGYVSEVPGRPRAITDDDPLQLSSYRFKLDEVTAEEYVKLPAKFRDALAKAQVIEANEVLAPTDSIEEKRRKGVILETIHEVKMMFSSTTPVNQKISRNAMRVLGPYLDTTVRLRRT